MESKEDIEKRIAEIEEAMNASDFWQDKEKAQAAIKEYGDLKDALSGVGKYDKGDAVLTIFAGAGGADAEDFARMLLDMYAKFIESRGWGAELISSSPNEHNGYRTVTVEINGKNVYGTLKNESGVHRLVRISPFNANSKRQTSFAMVEVVPKLSQVESDFSPEDVTIEFTRTGGPGGQNVNKRETAVRAIHNPSGISIVVDGERSQERNREKALEILAGRLYYVRKQEQEQIARGLSVSKSVENQWGNQIRSYVLHPYQLVKDHRTDTEVRDVEKVLNGDIEKFLEAERNL